MLLSRNGGTILLDKSCNKHQWKVFLILPPAYTFNYIGVLLFSRLLFFLFAYQRSFSFLILDLVFLTNQQCELSGVRNVCVVWNVNVVVSWKIRCCLFCYIVVVVFFLLRYAWAFEINNFVWLETKQLESTNDMMSSSSMNSVFRCFYVILFHGWLNNTRRKNTRKKDQLRKKIISFGFLIQNQSGDCFKMLQ
jgi:hypothetical protein